MADKTMSVGAGLLWVSAAYVFWGVSPIFWKELEVVPPFALLAHRVVWSAVFSLPVFFRRKTRVELAGLGRQQWLFLFLNAALIVSNWYFYVVAMTTHRVLDSSLAYFLTPLGNIMLAVVLLRERLNRLQAMSVVLAGIAVAILTVALGRLPFLVLYLAGSFALYGYFKKRLRVQADVSVAVESLMIAPLLLIYLFNQPWAPGSLSMWGWLALTGPVTVVPLVWYAKAIVPLRLVTIGFLQYLSPILQFVIAVFLYHEPFGWAQGLTFALIWIALAIFSWDLLRRLPR